MIAWINCCHILDKGFLDPRALRCQDLRFAPGTLCHRLPTAIVGPRASTYDDTQGRC